jgi:hypothetical protein
MGELQREGGIHVLVLRPPGPLAGRVAAHVMHAAAPRPGEQVHLRSGPLIEIVEVAEPAVHLG